MKTRFIIALVALGILLTACGGGAAKEDKDPKTPKNKENPNSPQAALTDPDEVVGIGRVEPEGEIIPLASMEPGVVVKVFVKQGDAVKAGDLLLELDHATLDAQIEQVRRRATTQAARIKTDEKSLGEAQLRLATLKTNVTRTENLAKGGAETGQNLFDQRSELLLQENAVQRWQAVIEADRAQLSEIQGDGLVLQQQVMQRMVRAPLAGKILTMRALPGSFVSSQMSFADFAPEGKTVVRSEIDELFAGFVKIGQEAHIVEMGTKKELSKGHVIYVSDFLKRKSLFSENAGEMEDRRVREVHVLIDSGEPMLINSRVECHIKTSNPISIR